MCKDLETVLDEAALWARSLRREFHRRPEVGNQEWQTAQRIEEALGQLKIPCRRLTGTGVLGLLEGKKLTDRPCCVALRADIDGLPVQEELSLPFASQRSGFMHACGHDVHAAVLLGTAKVLSALSAQWQGTVKLLFQPAEETSGGALPLIAAGCLENPTVDYIFGLHVKPELPAGTIGIQYGMVHGASDSFRIELQGKKAHGASPHQGADGIVAAAQILFHLQTLISRGLSPLDSAAISIGRIEGGAAANVLADHVTMDGTLRSLLPQTGADLKQRIQEGVQAVAAAAGVHAQIHWTPGYPCLCNSPSGTQLAHAAAEKALGPEKVQVLTLPSLGVEDFAYYLQQRPGAFFFLGSGFPDRENPGLHSGRFQINEDCLCAGIAVETALVLELLSPSAPL